MGTLVLSKTNRLFWLGRYVERTIIETDLIQGIYDQAIDGPEFDHRKFCEQLEIPDPYTTSDEFIQGFLFDRDFEYSIINTLNYAYDNAIVLRETISSEALSYIQMAVNVMESAAAGVAPMLDLQTVTDYLYAFRGCSDDSILDTQARYTVKCGSSVERIDLYIRLNYKTENLDRELTRLNGRLQHTPLARDGKLLMFLLGMAPNPDPLSNRKELLDAIEGLFTGV